MKIRFTSSTLKQRISKLYLLMGITTFLQGCAKQSPGGFWQNFEKDSLQENLSDQGPRGGHRALHWHNAQPHTFSTGKVLDFAKRNEWELLDSTKLNSNEMAPWQYNSKLIFPLSEEGFSKNGGNNGMFAAFPRWITTDVTIYTFATGWLSFAAGTNAPVSRNGFVLINKEQTDISVYHIWGE